MAAITLGQERHPRLRCPNSSDLPREIRVTELSEGVHYYLPTRRLGRMAVVRLVIVLFGVPFACSGVVGMIVARLFADQLFWLLGIAAELLSVAVLASGVFLILSGLWMAIGHAYPAGESRE